MISVSNSFLKLPTMINTPIIDKLPPGFIAVARILAVFFVPYLLGFIVASFSELRVRIYYV